jgi:hypothetical protein
MSQAPKTAVKVVFGAMTLGKEGILSHSKEKPSVAHAF